MHLLYYLSETPAQQPHTPINLYHTKNMPLSHCNMNSKKFGGRWGDLGCPKL